jgi:hypothetical protein
MQQLEGRNLQLVPVIIELFKQRYQGKASAAKSEQIIFHMKATGAAAIRPQDIRAIIGHIRNHDLLCPNYIVSSVHTGYWLTADKTELSGFIDQELNRMSNQYGNIKALHQRMRTGKRQDLKEQQQELF